MSIDQARYYLNSLKNRYILLRSTEVFLLAAGVAMLVFTLEGFVIVSASLKIGISIVAGLIVCIVRILRLELHRFSRVNVVQFVNERYPGFQESADLLLNEDENLTSLQQLQKGKVLEKFKQLYPTIKLPQRIGQAAIVFVACSILYIVLSGFAITAEQTEMTNDKGLTDPVKPVNSDPAAILIESVSIQVKPPAYTGLASVKPGGLALSLPEGSSVNWLAEFSDQVKEAKIVFSGRDSIKMKKVGDFAFTASQTILTSGFYQFQWRNQVKTYRSDYFRIDVIKDQPPKISITNLPQFTQLAYNDKLSIEVSSNIIDDYGLTDAQIVATVSKGSGEGIKFREEKIRFSSPQRISGKQVIAESTLNLTKLGLEPGDELYFYVEATDNKTPIANRNRTETFFISLKDTASYAMVEDQGLGVDLMPEYFRSQRQIIIDTEKLLKQQKEKKVTKQQFNFTSNELGFDQKTLRLRYGQFLGEEADSGIPEALQPVEEDHTDEEGKEIDPTKIMAHEHDTKNEHNLVADKKVNLHGHDEQESKTAIGEEENEDPLKAFVHQHDNQEEATFFVVSVKTKLKMALSVMWDAELHLRLYDPAKSLPYQYKALNLLKEISNDSRIYVHRMGFDPPPLKEEKRLTADLSEIKSSTDFYSLDVNEKFPSVKKAIALLEKLTLEKQPALKLLDKQTLTRAGDELASASIEQPGMFLTSLSLIRNLVDDEVPAQKMKESLVKLKKDLWSVLPHQPASSRKGINTVHELDRTFMKQLNEVKHE
ncbi:MAG TPA: DUF4175 family protein [Cyclobacteriaceae bacterium]|nr:DUF4175 family protein [Cyclobacteriaceae bacterium]